MDSEKPRQLGPAVSPVAARRASPSAANRATSSAGTFLSLHPQTAGPDALASSGEELPAVVPDWVGPSTGSTTHVGGEHSGGAGGVSMRDSSTWPVKMACMWKQSERMGTAVVT